MANSTTGDIHKVMATSITGDIHKATTWSIVLSVLMIAAGVLAIFSPAIAGVAVTVFFGWLLIFSGILHLAYAWQAGRPGAVVWEMLLGILYGGIGVYLLARPGAGLASLTIEVPQGVAARIRSKVALGSATVDESRFPRTLDGWASPDYDTATNRADLDLSGGLGSIRVA